MATTAGDITADIKWLMTDAILDLRPDYRVTTIRDGDVFVTTIHGANAALAELAG